ncbi:MAG TPA: DUF3592 domain-containing protein [Bacteroidia bacterium]|nr:DUF3592 domain-containing protein [Bacteroidia bacterium]
MSIAFSRARFLRFGLMIILLLSYTQRFYFLHNGRIADGKVTSVSHRTSFAPRYGNIPYSVPIIQYRIGNQLITVDGDQNLPYKEGESISVIYDPENPDDYYLFTFWGFWFVPLTYTILPVILLCSAVFSFWEKDRIIIIGRKKEN